MAQQRVVCQPAAKCVGSGRRLFAEGTVPAGLELVDSKTSRTGVVMGTYRSAGEIVTGSFASD